LSVAAFGNAVHVAGLDEALVLSALEDIQQKHPLQIAASRANLEDVFISMIAAAPDNFVHEAEKIGKARRQP